MCVCEGVGRAAGPQRGWGGRTCDGRLTVQSIGRAAPRTASPEPHTVPDDSRRRRRGRGREAARVASQDGARASSPTTTLWRLAGEQAVLQRPTLRLNLPLRLLPLRLHLVLRAEQRRRAHLPPGRRGRGGAHVAARLREARRHHRWLSGRLGCARAAAAAPAAATQTFQDVHPALMIVCGGPCPSPIAHEPALPPQALVPTPRLPGGTGGGDGVAPLSALCLCVW